MKKGEFVFSFMFVLVICLSICLIVSFGGIASAVSYNSSLSSIESEYNAGDVLGGVLSISLDDDLKSDKLSAKFSGDLGGRISLLDFLNNQTTISYECFPSGCEDYYAVSGDKLTSENYNLVGSKLIGIVLSGNEVQIDELKFSVSSDASASCSNQLLVDVLSNEEVNWVNNNALSETCGSEIKSECNSEKFESQASILSDSIYCEKITLKQAPGVRVSMGISTDKTPDYSKGILKAWLYDENGGEIDVNCDLSNPANGRAVCDLKYPIKQQADYYVCVSLGLGETAKGYKLAARQQQEHFCGLASEPGLGDFVADYDITAYSLKYGAITPFTLNDNIFEVQNSELLIDYINEYIGEKYSRVCTAEGGCVIPIKFSGVSQKLSISNFDFSYINTAGSFDGTKFYEVVSTPAKLNMDSTQLDLSKASLKVPSSPGDYKLELFIGDEKITEENIKVKAKQTSLINQVYPSNVAVLEPNVYVAFVNPYVNLTDAVFKWDFGDGSSVKTSNENKIIHSYSTIKSYEGNVEIYKDGQVITSYTFNVDAVSPKEAINTTIEKYKKSLDKVENQLLGFSDEYLAIINIDVPYLKEQLTDIEEKYLILLEDSETTSQSYVELMGSLISLNIPIAVQPSKIINTRFISDVNKIDVSKIIDLFSEMSVSSEEVYGNAISDWSINDAHINLEYKLISIYYIEGAEKVLSEYNFEVSGTNSNTVYAVIEKAEDSLLFNDDYDISYESDDLATGVTLDLIENNKLSFAVPYESDVFELPVYFSPVLSELSIGSDEEEPESKGVKLWMIILLVVFLLILALVAYIFLLRYYKYKYEEYLFSNPGDLQNLLNFIKMSKAKGMNDKDIREKLLKAKWTDEQIDYAFKKYKGEAIIWEPKVLERFTEKKPVEESVKNNVNPKKTDDKKSGFFKIKK